MAQTMRFVDPRKGRVFGYSAATSGILPAGAAGFFKRRLAETLGLVLFGFSFWLIAALFSYTPGAPSLNNAADGAVGNLLGAAGACPQPQGHHLIDHPRALALTTGLWRPRVWLTKGLTQALSTEAVAIVLAHEHTHRQRRDPLRHLLAGLSRLLPHSRTLLTDLHQTSEHLADHHAATIGGPRQGAETLIQVQRLTQPPIGRGHSAFAEGDLTARIHRLLHPPVEPRHVRARLALFALILLGATLASVGPLHHFSEWVMGVG